jgi:flagellin
MALNVISNFAANVAHRNLSVNDRMTTASLSKLSSGSRVVSAKDDAASLAIGSRLNAEVQAQKQAQVNAIQATSMLQIADGAMAKVSDILVRMKTLAVQAGSGQLSSTERSFLDTEYQSLLSEIDRIASDTEFNGTQLVAGSTTTTTTENGQSSTNNVIEAADGFASITLANSVGDAAIAFSYDAGTNVLTATNLTDGTSQGVDIGSTAVGSYATQTVNFANLGVVVELNSTFDKTTDVNPANSATLTGNVASGAIGNVRLTQADSTTALSSLSAITGTISAITNVASVSVTIGAFSGTFNGSATANNAELSLSNGSDGFVLTFDITTALVSSAGATSAISIGDLGSLVFGSSTSSNTTSFTYKLGTGNTTNVDDVTISVNGISTSALSLNGGDITDVTNANTASTAVTAAINTLNTARSGVGAAQNRLEFASDNLSSTIENSEAARSNLMDLDVASEMTNFTSKQILVQVGVSMLAQANQLPQNLLQLFR